MKVKHVYRESPLLKPVFQRGGVSFSRKEIIVFATNDVGRESFNNLFVFCVIDVVKSPDFVVPGENDGFDSPCE